MTAWETSSDDVLSTVMLDKKFYKAAYRPQKESNYAHKDEGGMTLSGGEPLLQPEFALALLRGAKENGIHTAVDTAGHVPFSRFEQILDYTDLFLYDLKCMDDDIHTRATGVSNALILENLTKLSAHGANIIVRIPVIHGINDTDANMKNTAELLLDNRGQREKTDDRGQRIVDREKALNYPLSTIHYPLIKVELLGYHKLGGGKYESLGLEYPAAGIEPLDKGRLLQLASHFTDKGIDVTIS